MSNLPAPPTLDARRVSAWLLALAAAIFAGYLSLRVAGAALTGGPAIAEELAYDLVFFLAAAACLVRARSAGAERGAWTLIGWGLTLSAIGYLYSSLSWMLAPEAAVPFPSPADVAWVLQYPLIYAGVVRLARVRGRAGSGIAADSALAALALASLAAALIVPSLSATTGGDPAAIITNVVYPLADIHLIGFVLLAGALGGRRLGPVWGVLLAVGALTLVTDGVYLLQVANDTYIWGTILDAGWPAVALGYAIAAFMPVPTARRAAPQRTVLLLLVPALATLAGTGILVHTALGGGSTAPLVLATLTLLAAVTRAVQVAAVAHRLQRDIAQREDQLVQAQALAQAGSFEFDAASGRVEWSAELWRLSGLEPGSIDLSATRVADIVHPDDVDRLVAQLRAARSGEGRFETSYRFVRADGQVRSVDMRGDMRDGVLRASIQDVTVQRRIEESLRQSEARYRHVVENAHDGIWLLDPSQRTVFINRRMAAMLGRPPEDVLGRSPAELSDADSAALIERWAAVESPDGGEGMQFEARFVRPDGAVLWAMVSMSRLEDWSTGGSALMVTDITDRKLLEERLRRGAEEDALTGLPNRAVFERVVDEEVAGAEPIAVVLLDLDHFKFVNDSFGHGAGDELLRHVAGVLSQAVPAGDMVARFGGDEFALLLRGQDREAAHHTIEGVLQSLRDHRWREHGRHSASAGIAIARPGVPTGADDLLKAADIALYEAKDAGRDRCAVYSGPDGGMAWVDEVRAAIRDERLLLYSQRLASLTGAPDREELLVRMVGADGEILSPASFIPTAEQFGLIADLDVWVAGQAIALARTGRRIELNVSGASLGEPRIPELVAAAVADGLDPTLLTFEVTETATVRNLDGARTFVERLRALGCGVALDDFGTGYGSLTYLRHIPVTQIKIDMDFVRHILDQPDDERMVRTIVGIAGTLGLETVAEGVEDLAAIELLREIGVDFAQGYALDCPRPLTVPVAS